MTISGKEKASASVSGITWCQIQGKPGRIEGELEGQYEHKDGLVTGFRFGEITLTAVLLGWL